MLFFSSFTLCLRLYLGSLSLAKFFQVWQSFTSDKTGLCIKIAQKTIPSRTFCFFFIEFSAKEPQKEPQKKTFFACLPTIALAQSKRLFFRDGSHGRTFKRIDAVFHSFSSAGASTSAASDVTRR